METATAHESDLNLKATELRLGLPGTVDDHQSADQNSIFSSGKNNKRASPEMAKEESGDSKCVSVNSSDHQTAAPAPKAQIVGWPPVKSYRKNNIQQIKTENESGMFVKVSMDGAPYLRKIDLKLYSGYSELLKALEAMFKLNIGEYTERESEYAFAYEDKDGDLMLVGDVPFEYNVYVILQETENHERSRS
ncbi:Iaa2p [Castilleja foliolosa]|uniref:Auxin-responsive protein n=1 Tax=Castilleja foliolosa TaxID=1961234 RepID=A0ABD3E7L2_9LAMI